VPFIFVKALKWTLRALLVVVLGVFVYLVVTVIQVLAASQASQTPSSVAEAKAVLVMGEPTKPDLSKDVVNRLEQALSLYTAKRAPLIVIPGASGGVLQEQAALEIRFLEQQGLARSHIELVGGTDDASVLSSAAKLLGRTGTPRVILVSDPLDALRLRASATAAGLTGEISPATPPPTGFFTDVGSVWRQATTVAAGRVFGF
jgi:uncharacterized SAM-binding protein YcdF (DUF218 family)